MLTTSSATTTTTTTSNPFSGGGFSSSGGESVVSDSNTSTVATTASATVPSVTISSLEATLATLVQELEARGITIPPYILSSLGAPADTASIATSSTIATPSAIFTRNLTLGSSGADVKELQELLNAQGFLVAKSGAGSKGHETSYFGPSTQAALERLQKAYGITPAAGYFGSKTRALLERL
jgi:hypothetical protein